MKCYKNVVKNVIKTLNVESPGCRENVIWYHKNVVKIFVQNVILISEKRLMKCYNNIIKNVLKMLNIESPGCGRDNIFMMFYKTLIGNHKNVVIMFL